MGKSATRGRRKEQYPVVSQSVNNMVVMDDYRNHSNRKSVLNYNRTVSALNERQEALIQSILTNRISFGIGEAGTGKTYLAVRLALQLLAKGLYRKLYIARPAVEFGEKLGFIPGDGDAKLYPYLIPIYDILEEELGVQTTKALIAAKVIEVVPLGFIGGRTLKNAIIILDELQNATYAQIKLALTRMGENSKTIVTGDPKQNALKPGESGLMEVAKRLKEAPKIGAVFFETKDVVRDEIVQTVLEYL
jgi:phosphate starvation-inducible PhoH-like protein